MKDATLHLLLLRHRVIEVLENSEGFSTAELLGNAALAIVALVAIWGFLRIVGIDVLRDIQTAIENALH